MARCHYCQRPAAKTRDHVVPKSLGGRDHHTNYVPACQPCNAEKGNRLPWCTCRHCLHAIVAHWKYAYSMPDGVRQGLLSRVEGMRTDAECRTLLSLKMVDRSGEHHGSNLVTPIAYSLPDGLSYDDLLSTLRLSPPGRLDETSDERTGP